MANSLSNDPDADSVDSGDEESEVFLDEADVLHQIDVNDDDINYTAEDSDSEMQDMETEDELPDDSIKIFDAHSDEVYAVACSPTDPYLVAIGGAEDNIYIWRIDQIWSQKLEGHTDSVLTLAFSNDGSLLASGSFDGTVRIWEPNSGTLKHILEGPEKDKEIEWVKWHPRGHIVLAGSQDSTVWMWNGDKGTYLNCFTGHGRNVSCGDFTPDGKLICSASGDATLRIWNPKNGETIYVVRDYPYHTEAITCMNLSSDSSFAVTGSTDGSIRIVNISSGKVVSSLSSHSDSVECVAFSSSLAWVASASLDNKLIIWDVQHSSVRCTCDHESGVTCMAWVGPSRYIASGSQDGGVRVWDSLSGECVKRYSGHRSSVTAVAVSSSYKFLVSSSAEGHVRVFDISPFL